MNDTEFKELVEIFRMLKKWRDDQDIHSMSDLPEVAVEAVH